MFGSSIFVILVVSNFHLLQTQNVTNSLQGIISKGVDVFRSVLYDLLKALANEGRATSPSNVIYHLNNRRINDTILNPKTISLLNNSLPLAFIIHGWYSKVSYVPPMIKAYLQRYNSNVIFVDWSKLSDVGYVRACVNTQIVGVYVARLITFCHKTYASNITDVHLIGHSLGAQLGAAAARAVRNETGIQVGHLTGLDPAGPLFFGNPLAINKHDAQLVDAIHTDAGVEGIPGAVGDVDFFPNGGIPPQPGCDDLTTCSHGRSHALYTEALQDSHAFVSTNCSNYVSYLIGACRNNHKITIGGDYSDRDSGTYFLRTRGSYPYSEEE